MKRIRDRDRVRFGNKPFLGNNGPKYPEMVWSRRMNGGGEIDEENL